MKNSLKRWIDVPYYYIYRTPNIGITAFDVPFYYRKSSISSKTISKIREERGNSFIANQRFRYFTFASADEKSCIGVKRSL